LHHYIIKSDYFPHNPREAIKRGFREAEEFFLNIALYGE
jgi:hypothetical protein